MYVFVNTKNKKREYMLILSPGNFCKLFQGYIMF